MSTQISSGGLVVGQTIDHLYKSVVRVILENGVYTPGNKNPLSVGKQRNTAELLNLTCILKDVRSNILKCDARPLSMRYILGNFMWNVFGRDDLDFIQFYNPLGKKFSDDGKSLYGAYGPRISSSMDMVVSRLTVDGTDRRCVVPVFRTDDLSYGSKDIPCLVAMIFTVRESKLYLTAYWRSQSMLMVFPYDVALMTMLQTWMARRLSTGLGSYTNIACSAHIYMDEVVRAKTMLKEDSGYSSIPTEYAIVGDQNIWAIERNFRLNRSRVSKESVSNPFWSFVGDELGWWI